jgi:hypothetical protein
MSDLDKAPLAELARLYFEELRKLKEFLASAESEIERADGKRPEHRS